jgi:hypothetical protein
MWANRETRELYNHLSKGTIDVSKIITALEDVNGDPSLWSDYERQAIRILAAIRSARPRSPECAPKLVRSGASTGPAWPASYSETADTCRWTRPCKRPSIRLRSPSHHPRDLRDDRNEREGGADRD